MTQHQQTELRDEVKQIVAQSETLAIVQRRLYRWLYHFRNAKSSHNPFKCQPVDSLEGGVGPRDQHIEINREKKHTRGGTARATAVELIKTHWEKLKAGPDVKLVPFDDINGQGVFVQPYMLCSQWFVSL